MGMGVSQQRRAEREADNLLPHCTVAAQPRLPAGARSARLRLGAMQPPQGLSEHGRAAQGPVLPGAFRRRVALPVMPQSAGGGAAATPSMDVPRFGVAPCAAGARGSAGTRLSRFAPQRTPAPAACEGEAVACAATSELPHCGEAGKPWAERAESSTAPTALRGSPRTPSARGPRGLRSGAPAAPAYMASPGARRAGASGPRVTSPGHGGLLWEPPPPPTLPAALRARRAALAQSGLDSTLASSCGASLRLSRASTPRPASASSGPAGHESPVGRERQPHETMRAAAAAPTQRRPELRVARRGESPATARDSAREGGRRLSPLPGAAAPPLQRRSPQQRSPARCDQRPWGGAASLFSFNLGSPPLGAQAACQRTPELGWRTRPRTGLRGSGGGSARARLFDNDIARLDSPDDVRPRSRSKEGARDGQGQGDVPSDGGRASAESWATEPSFGPDEGPGGEPPKVRQTQQFCPWAPCLQRSSAGGPPTTLLRRAAPTPPPFAAMHRVALRRQACQCRSLGVPASATPQLASQ
jgi:hypothetical protein